MKGIGVDIFCLDRIDLSRIATIKRVLTNQELAIFNQIQSEQGKKEYFGSRFAAKEAYIKACHQKIEFKSIEVLNEENGQPYFTNDNKALLSISHEKHYAIAFVMIEE